MVDQRLGRRSVQCPHSCDRGPFLVVGSAGQHDAGADGLRQHEDITWPRSRFRQDAIGMDEALHGETAYSL